MSKKDKAKQVDDIAIEEQVKVEQNEDATTSEESSASEVEELQKDLVNEKDKFKRLFAEFENDKKRTSKERLELFKTANQDVMTAMLPILDDFERALMHIEEDKEAEELRKGVLLIYNKLINGFHNQESLSIDNFINDLDSNSSKIVSDILINDDKYQLHDWERKNIYVKKIGSELSQLVNETILNMRRYLIDKKINELQEFQKDGSKPDVLEEVMSYYKLKKMLSAKLNRVV